MTHMTGGGEKVILFASFWRIAQENRYASGSLQDILSPEMKFNFCQNDRNKMAPVMKFISGCIR